MSALQTIPQTNAEALVRFLTALGDEFEANGDAHWLPIAQAAATLEGLRLGLATIEPLAVAL